MKVYYCPTPSLDVQKAGNSFPDCVAGGRGGPHPLHEQPALSRSRLRPPHTQVIQPAHHSLPPHTLRQWLFGDLYIANHKTTY
jgi:hypothetical protein